MILQLDEPLESRLVRLIGTHGSLDVKTINSLLLTEGLQFTQQAIYKQLTPIAHTICGIISSILPGFST